MATTKRYEIITDPLWKDKVSLVCHEEYLPGQTRRFYVAREMEPETAFMLARAMGVELQPDFRPDATA